MTERDWNYPLYAAKIHDDLRCEIIGGPFRDIDDVLDACWDAGAKCDRDAGEIDREYERFFIIEMGSGRPVVRTFPYGAFPTEAEVAEASG